MTARYRIGCFSYLARVHTLNIAQQPVINYGTNILSQDSFLAGDGPIVAGVLAAFGHHPALGANHPAVDDAGRELRARLNAWQVPLLPGPTTRRRTRTNIVACDQNGNRTWFADLENIADELATIDLDALVGNDAVYVDAYEVLDPAAAAVIAAATDAGRYTVVNLGGSATPAWLAGTANRVDVLQTNGPENDEDALWARAHELHQLKAADLVVVTGGHRGAYAIDIDGNTFRSAATAVDARQPQGAGAAFSAALLHGHFIALKIPQRLRFACAAGSLWCTRDTLQSPPTLRDIEDFLRP